MKRIYLLFSIIILTLLSSCENKEKYYGEWMMIPPYEPTNQVEKIAINKDSIFIGVYPFHKLHSESLKLNGNKLELFKRNFKVEIENDSLLHFNNSTYIKKGYPFYDNTIYNPEKLISIEYPKIGNIKPLTENGKTKYGHILFGKKLNSDEFGLQLHDRISDFGELKWFLSDLHGLHDLFPAISLTVDKNSRMKGINDIFFYAKSMNILKIKLINDVSYYFNNEMILTSEESVFIRLSPFILRNLGQNKLDQIKVKLPPPPTPSFETIISGKNYDIISLVKNELFFGLKKIYIGDLAELIKTNYSMENYLIVSYDNESTYKYFLELINTLNNTFSEIRNNASLKTFGKSLDSLTRKEKGILINQVPSNMINGISLEDLRSLNIAIPELELLD